MSFASCLISEFISYIGLVFFVVPFLGLRFYCALVPSTLALDLPILVLSRLWFSSLTVCDHRRICISLSLVSLSDEEPERTLGVLLMMSMGRKNGFISCGDNINRINAYIYPPRYAIRTSQKLRTQSYIYAYLVPLHTTYTRACMMRGTSWYQPVIPLPA